MQFNKNKSAPSILSMANVVFTKKNQSSKKKSFSNFLYLEKVRNIAVAQLLVSIV